MVGTRVDTLIQRRGVRQFVKFCIVGATSFTIDVGISTLLVFTFHMWWVLAKTISFILAVTNGFFWNQRWTFRAVGQRRQRDQYAMFFMVNIVGYFINMGMMKLAFFVLTGSWLQPNLKRMPNGMAIWLTATLAATAVVVFWNFFANKYWTFRHKSA